MWKTMLNETTKLTLELREIVDNGENSVNIWDFDYPSYYQGEEKKAFEQKVTSHFYMRQIGFETVGLFLHHFRNKVREIMPYYVQLYKSQEIMEAIEDPFGNVDITETFTQTSSDTSTGSSSDTSTGSNLNTSTGSSSDTSTSSSSDTSTGSTGGNTSGTSSNNKTHKFSNTPQGSIQNLSNYLTEASEDVETANNSTTSETSSNSTSETSSNSTSNATSETTSNGTLSHTFTKKGNQGVNTYAHDMFEYRKTFLNIDMQIIEELNCLFLQVY